MFNNTLGLSLHGGTLVSIRHKTSTVVREALPPETYQHGMATDKEAFKKVIIKHRNAHNKGVMLFPPRMLFAGWFGGDSSRIFVKDCLIQSGARDVLLLELGMALAVGHQEESPENQKGVYVLVDGDLLQIYAVEKHQVITDHSCRAEIEILNDAKNRIVTPLNKPLFSDEAVERARSILRELKHGGFISSNVFLYGTAPQDPLIQQLLHETNLPVQVLSEDTLLKGLRKVLGELPSILGGKAWFRRGR